MVNQLNLLGYSQSTIRCYVQELAQFLYFIKDKKASKCKLEDITEFLLHCLSALKLKENTIHSRINGIKFYFEEILKQPKIVLEIPRPKKQLKLPKALHSTEIKAIFNVTENLKHNTILKLCYGMGLRVSEIVQLKIYDIDSKNMRVHVQKGKGKKDRYVNLPESILSQLRKYYHEYKPKNIYLKGSMEGSIL
ncbi:tyrosine-type recombinase/integrase [Flavobacterium oreochromis]|uniref:tyrosine-type recombinase/integrase n=1 Tax=Flavobacterium oreochromis TaxID=2906078 RepID=UPI00385D41BB